MTSSADPHDPRLIIMGVGFVIVLLAGALFTAFLQTWDSNWPVTAQKPDRLAFAEKVFQDGDDATAAKMFSELAAKDNGMAQYWLAHMTELGLGVSRDLPKAITLYKKSRQEYFRGGAAAGQDLSAWRHGAAGFQPGEDLSRAGRVSRRCAGCDAAEPDVPSRAGNACQFGQCICLVRSRLARRQSRGKAGA